MNVSIVLPADLVPASATDTKRWVIDTAVNAARAGVQPITPDKSGKNHNLKAYLGQGVMSAFSAKPRDVPMSEYIAGLVNAAVIESRRQARENGRAAQEAAAPVGLRPEQQRLIEHAEAQAALGGVVFAEAGTGVGKTMAALAMAARYADRTGRPAVFAVPTLAVLAQAVDEYTNHLSPAMMGLARKPEFAFLIGRGNFVNPALLRDMIDNPGDIPATGVEQARAWVNAGAGGAPGAKTALLHRSVPDLAWLVEDLHHAAPDFPADQVRLSEESPEDCPAQAIYQRFREKVRSAEVVVCTHAMLGLDVLVSARTPEELENRLTDIDHRIESAVEKAKSKHPADAEKHRPPETLVRDRARAEARLTEARKEVKDGADLSPILPRYGFLLIDEAHQFESAIANLRSSEVNPRLLAAEISAKMDVFVQCKRKTAAEQTVGLLEQLHGKLSSLGAKVDKERVRLNGPAEGRHRGLADAIAPIIEKLAGKNGPKEVTRVCPSARPLLSPLSSVVRNLIEDGDGVWVNFSPRRRFPSLHTGPRTIRYLLERIWDRVDAAVLLSATLALPDINGLPKVSFLAAQLSTPSARMKVISPIVQPWLYAPVLHPVGKGRHDLRPPVMDGGGEIKADKQSLAGWAEAIGGEVRRVAETANGGTLVLTSGYDRVTAIARALPDLAERIVAQQRRSGVRAAQAQFEAKARAGLRPIWLATGPAWTGLDVSDKSLPAEQDFMLTDLVITNIPFNTNRSTTHQARLEWMKLAERDRAALEFKQGIGRLMRRQGLQGRRLHILDPRVWTMTPYYTPFRRMLEPYQHGI